MLKNTRPGFPKISAEAGPAERWWLTVRAQTSRQLPLESVLSWPIPLWQQEDFCLTVFYYGVRRVAGPGTGVALPPIARLIATYPATHLITFLHRKAGNLFPGLPDTGELGPLVATLLSPGERMNERRALFALYTPLLSQYQSDIGETDHRSSFRTAFQRLAEPGLLPYYRALNPQFFDWLEANREFSHGI
jgi:hypothetical protein